MRTNMQNLYQFAVAWIAMNDDAETVNPRTIEQSVAVKLIADMFFKDVEPVAIDVRRYRLAKQATNEARAIVASRATTS